MYNIYFQFGILVSLVYIVLILHELIHYFFIKVFKKEVISVKVNILGASIKYKNDNRYIEILIISISPAIILTILGLLISYVEYNYYIKIFGIICLLNLVHITPITIDGKVILYSLYKIYTRSRY